MSLQMFAERGYHDIQAKVREVTSNDPWGPSGTQMYDIAQMTHNRSDFVEAMEMLNERLNDNGKNWRSVFKSLTVIDYLLRAGSENGVVYFRDNIHLIKTLREFQHIDEYGKDQGANVRQKAKEITNFLMDEERLRQERRSWVNIHNWMVDQAGHNDDNDEPLAPRGDEKNVHQTRGAEGDDDLRRAIEESNRTLAAEQSRDTDADLARAIQLSEEEAARQKATLTGPDSLFDEPGNDLGGQNNGIQPQFTMQPQFTSFNLHQQQARDWQETMQAEWARRQQEWTMLQRQQQEEWMMLQQRQQQQQSQLQAQHEERMRQQLALKQTAPPMRLLPLVPSVDSSPAISPVFALPDSPPLPISAYGSVQRGAMNGSLSVRTSTDVSPMLSAASASSADTSFASADADTCELPPPAYSSTGHSTS